MAAKIGIKNDFVDLPHKMKISMPSMVSLYRFSTIANSNMAFKTVSENPIWRKSKMAAKIDPKGAKSMQ